MDTMESKKSVHPKVKSVLERILSAVEVALQQGETQASLAEKCGITHQQMNRLIRGLRGSNLTLNMAFKVWEGLGKSIDHLFPGPVPEDIMVKTEEIYQSPDAEVLKQFVEILYNKRFLCEDFDKLRNLVLLTHHHVMAKIKADT